MDLKKYAVQQPTSTAPADFTRFSVAESAPTVDQLLNIQKAYKDEPTEETLVDKLKNRGTQAINSVFGKQQYPGQQVLGVTGAAGGAVNDVLAALLSPVIDTVVDRVSDVESVQDVATSRVGSAVIDLASGGVQAAAKTFKKFEEKAPGTARFATDVFNTSTLIPAGVATKEAGAIAKDTAQLTSRMMTPSENAVQTKVLSMFEKAIKPTAKKTNALAEKYSNDAVTALKEIKANASKLNIEDATGELVNRAPQSLNELNQAVEQTKKFVFDQYDALAKSANEKGVTIKVEEIAKQLDDVAQNRALELTSPEVIKYAQSWAERLRNIGELDAPTTQEVIKTMNNNLQSFYKNPTYDSASKVAVDAGIANNFRQALDNAIEGATGESYSSLKKIYGSLKAIENDVTRAAMRDARKNVKGLLDYTDILTGGQIVSGILSLNPAMFTKGAIERGFKEYIKFINDPNRVIKNIFDALEPAPSSFTPQSGTFNAIKGVADDLTGPESQRGFVNFGAATKITPEEKLQVAKALESYDTAPMTVTANRQQYIDMTSADDDLRLSQLQDKNAKGTFTDADAEEARDLLKKMGAL